ncbi:hypothetical protein IE81DRAFT_116567 [Ceraceosorus guamensis]|uniref:Uncharacterized protein n=1 Tax=Ceraceosorus guamensis TaxID=1522189 RepID=A0A316VZ76_9BASI|nr:hypothetical protein IE81DRAFT_116567 [Ceraceosorus guamensis]PWN42820.1 hypothetical protein IE81DRAFT_116567 [Ceraceosorus guamensis]
MSQQASLSMLQHGSHIVSSGRASSERTSFGSQTACRVLAEWWTTRFLQRIVVPVPVWMLRPDSKVRSLTRELSQRRVRSSARSETTGPRHARSKCRQVPWRCSKHALCTYIRTTYIHPFPFLHPCFVLLQTTTAMYEICMVRRIHDCDTCSCVSCI